MPSKVRSELHEGGERNQAALKALSDYSLFESCDDYVPDLLQQLLLSRTAARADRDEGEAEAVAQAAKRDAHMVLTDDPLGRKWAERHTKACHGTIWICRELRRTGYLLHLRPYFVRMIQGGRRQPLDKMNRFLREFAELEVTPDEYRQWINR